MIGKWILFFGVVLVVVGAVVWLVERLGLPLAVCPATFGWARQLRKEASGS